MHPPDSGAPFTSTAAADVAGDARPTTDIATAFVLRYGRTLAESGYPSHRIEDGLVELCERLGLRGQFFATPTSIFASFGPDEGQHTHLIRVEPSAPDIGRLTAVERIGDDVMSGQLSAANAIERLDALSASPPPYGAVVTVVAFGLSSAVAALFLGGGSREIAAAALVGLLIGLLSQAVRRVPRLARVFEALAAFLTTFLLSAITHWAAPLSVSVASLAGLIILLPGLTLTVAMAELAARHLVSGTSRFFGALMTFVGLGFGVAMGTAAARILFHGDALTRAAHGLPGWTLVIGLLLAPLGFTVLMRGRLRDTPLITAVCVLGYLGGRLGALMFGPELGIFVGALTAGLASLIGHRLTRVSAGATLPPALLLLVPGSVGFRGLALLMDDRVLDGVQTAFRMTLMLAALVAGLFASTVILPVPRRR